MEKEEPAVMLARRLILLICFFFKTLISCSQVNLISQNPKAKKSWSFTLAPGFSKSKEASAFIIAPAYYVDLKIRKPYLFAYRIEVSQESTGRKGWTFSKGLGFSSYSYILYYDYDRETSVGTSLSDRKDFKYAHASVKVGKPFLINSFSIEPYIGISACFLVKAKYTYTNKYGGGSSDFTHKYKPWALGWDAGLRFAYQYSKNISFHLTPSFNKIQKKYFDPLGPPGIRQNYSYTIGLGVVKKIKSS
jgi:hypothetical protein